MTKNTLLIFIFSILFTTSQAQKKSELLSEIDQLKSVIDSVQNELFLSRKASIVSKTEADSYKAQAEELLVTNQSLMQNINSFTSASIEKSENIGKTLKSLREKETQLKKINDSFSRHDSIALLLLTDFKRVMGETATISVASGAVIVSLSQSVREALASQEPSQKTMAEAALTKIASVLKMHSATNIVVESLTNTGEFDVALNQATLLVNKLLKQHSINPNRISPVAKDGGFSEGLNIKVFPKFDAFYFDLREEMKAANK